MADVLLLTRLYFYLTEVRIVSLIPVHYLPYHLFFPLPLDDDLVQMNMSLS